MNGSTWPTGLDSSLGLTVTYYTSVKIIKNEVGCRDDSARLLHALNPPRSAFLVSTVFGTVLSLHPISFLMIFTLVPLIFFSHKYGQHAVGSLA